MPLYRINESLPDTPSGRNMRIVSLVPSLTELLFDLGLDTEVVGITKFCIHPSEWFKEKNRVGGTKDFKVEMISSLRPDIIIANKEENDKDRILELASRHNVLLTEIANVQEALSAIEWIGHICGRPDSANEMVQQIKSRQIGFPNIADLGKVAYMIWKNPYMAAGGDTYISAMLESAGWTNAFKDMKRYPEVTPEKIINAGADVIFLSSEPFPFREKHIQELNELCPGIPVKLVDGEMFSWYGSRMLKAFPYFGELHKRINDKAGE